MKTKILRIELYVLFFLSFVSVLYYFFGQSLPDNSLSISSQSEDYFTLSYYFSSVFAVISYFVGPWIVLPFLIFSFLYSFILSTRERRFDISIGLVLVGFFFFVTALAAPSFFGQGLRNFAQENVSIYVAFFVSLALGVLLFYMTLRGTFFVLLKRTQFVLERFGYKLIKNTQRLTTQSKTLAVEYKAKVKDLDIREKTSEMLKNPIPKIEKSLKKQSVQVEEKKLEAPKVEQSESREANPLTKRIVESPANESSTDNDQKPNPVREEISQTPFFKSNDLIDVISENINHNQVKGPDESYFKIIIEAIEGKLAEFKLDGRIINILKGPVVDTFELELGSGVKVSKVTGLSDDIGLVLNGAPIRIVYPMRGRSTIGIEVPRNPRDFIYLDEVLQSNAFNDSKQRLPIAMGKDAFGEVKVVDLAAMPHMLVAGATGAGKSVFINTLLVSLIIKKSPRELKLVLIDPKQLELALYSDLPHLMLPVITDPKTSAVSLLWAVQEMDRRYSILKELGVKNIEGFNKKVKSCDPSLLLKINEYYEDEETPGYELPYIVIVIDEFADLILSKSGKEIELNVNRLAAKARAAGIHLVVATQRPSTDVVTGVVKANFPTRVAFRVSTGHDSKTILDQYGAQKLLGKGDMLYKHGVDLLRLHSSFVEEDEIEGLLAKLATLPQQFNQDALEFLENEGEDADFEENSGSGGSFTSGTSDDPVYQQALEIVYESGSASASMLQRRLRVGYNRAANLIDELEKNGVVGPAQGSKPRKVLSRSE